MATVVDANKQKLYIPIIFDEAPARKAKQSVSEVIVIEGPACLKASKNLFFLDYLRLV